MGKAISTLLILITVTAVCYILYSKQMLPSIGSKPLEQAQSAVPLDNEAIADEVPDVADNNAAEPEFMPAPGAAHLSIYDHAGTLLANNINMGAYIADAVRLHAPRDYEVIKPAKDELGAAFRLDYFEREGGEYNPEEDAAYSVNATAELGRRLLADNVTQAAGLLAQAADRGLYQAKLTLIRYYEETGDTAKLCETVSDAYEKDGFELFSAGLVYKDQKPNMDTLLSCGILPADTMDAFDAPDARFILAQSLVAEGNFDEAMELLNREEPEISPALENNRLFCRAMLTYLGLGVDADREAGLSMLKTSYENGQLAAGVKLAEFGEVMENEYFPLPEKDNLTDYFTNVCSFKN